MGKTYGSVFQDFGKKNNILIGLLIDIIIFFLFEKYFAHFHFLQNEWFLCMQTWMYLEVLFSAPDIQRQLPNEARLFTMVDKSWKDIMRRTAKVFKSYCILHAVLDYYGSILTKP